MFIHCFCPDFHKGEILVTITYSSLKVFFHEHGKSLSKTFYLQKNWKFCFKMGKNNKYIVSYETLDVAGMGNYGYKKEIGFWKLIELCEALWVV